MKKIVYLIAVFCIYSNCIVAQSSMTPSDAGSKVHFVIKNFGIKTGGDFKGLKGVVKFYPANLPASSFDVAVDAGTVDTDNESRDEHLKKDDFFDAAKFKTIDIKSTKITADKSGKKFYLYANLTIKGVTKPIEFPFSVNTKDGGYVFAGDFQINRRDFGVGGSSVSMSDNVTVSLSVFAK